MISINCMVRDEPLAFYALASVAPYVNEVLVVDTGSSEEFLEPLYRAKELFPNIVIHETKIANAHSWRRVDGNTVDVDDTAGKLLGDLRRWMHNQSKNPIVMILDGDEVYSDKCAEYSCTTLAQKVLDNPALECAYVPFIDLLDVRTVRHMHDMGRLFKKDKTHLHGNYPHEMHYSNTINWCLLLGDDERVICIDDQLKLFACHYEHLIKPKRKPPTNLCPFTSNHPEVFTRYPEFWHLLEPYGLKPEVV